MQSRLAQNATDQTKPKIWTRHNAIVGLLLLLFTGNRPQFSPFSSCPILDLETSTETGRGGGGGEGDE
jgi:hypothetical protein